MWNVDYSENKMEKKLLKKFEEMNEDERSKLKEFLKEKNKGYVMYASYL